jgi:hypothetical protein
MDKDSTLSTSRTLPFLHGRFTGPSHQPMCWRRGGSDGFLNSFEVFEFKVGGRWKFVMRPDGTDIERMRLRRS